MAEILALSDAGTHETALRAIDTVTDPEIPVLTVRDLGVVRDVAVDGTAVTVTITPTYSGCPAMAVIEFALRDALTRAGFEKVGVETVLSPAWTTDWISEEGREKLRSIGIAPPAEASGSKRALFGDDPVVACPRCGSRETRMLSRFGSTACKALFTCESCQEPFDYFKCL
jgi:ring-1,2-phenylacetyl-CoA epoxidase subunit PaaD